MKKHRLNPKCYIGIRTYSLSIRTYMKQNYFKDESMVNFVKNVLIEISKKHNFDIEAYCFMPDHLHLLAQGKEGDSDLKTFVKGFKQKSGYEYSKVFKTRLWQPSYYDHVLRREESLKDVALYILNNPVRRGLVSDVCNYPFLGSLVFDINEL